jgi:Fusaric acid resistance protein-like
VSASLPPSGRPAAPDPPERPAFRPATGRLLADVRAGRAFLAAELRQSGWLDFGAFRWHDLAPGRAARAALGVITPLAIGVATGRPGFGSYAALGALPAGFVAFRGVTRTRVVAVTLAAVGMAVSTFVGATAAAGAPWILVPVIFVWAYAAGLLAALGPTALAVSLQWPIALLIGSAIPLDPAAAAVRALLVLAGGLFQGVLVVSSWAVARGSAERSALASSFRALGAYAADLRGGSQEPPGPATGAGRMALKDPNPLMRSDALLHLIDLAEEAERIRRSLTGLGIGRAPGGPRPAGRKLLSAAQLVLTEVAAALTARPALRLGHLEAARRELALASAEPGTRWQWAGDALLGQLRAAVRITERLNEPEPARTGQGAPAGPRLASVRDLALTLRASLSTSSEAGRHALRLAVVTALAEIIVRAAGLPHGYWGVLTIFIVLRPDYSSTLYRGLQRAAGTVVGAGLGVLTVQLVHISISALLAGIAVSLLAAYAVFTVNYLLYAVFLTDFVVVLLALLGLPPGPTAIDRLIGTGVGTGLALLAYVLWPTWEGASAGEKFARLFDAQGRYAGALLRSYTRPGDAGSGRRSELQLAARRARTDADASADRLAGEPEHPPMTAELARSLTAAAHRISQASITLAAAVTAHHAARPEDAGTALQQRLDELAGSVNEATGLLAGTLRELGEAGMADGSPDGSAAGQTGPPLPPLRARQQAIWLGPQGAGDATGQAGPGQATAARGPGEAAGLSAATDGLVDAINTAADVLRDHG